MKKLIYLIIGILSVQIVTALYGGETKVFHFDYCDQLRVNITGELQIDNGEYTVLNNCTETSSNYYICNCSNNYDFNVSFKTNTVNSYIFNFNYDYSMEVKETIVSSPGGTSSGYSSSWVCGNWSECLDNRTERVCWKGKRVNYTQFKSCVSKIETFIKEKEIIEIEVKEEINLTEKIETLEEEIPTEKDEKWIYLGIILITVIFSIFCFYVIRKKSHSTSKKSKKGNLAILFGLI